MGSLRGPVRHGCHWPAESADAGTQAGCYGKARQAGTFHWVCKDLSPEMEATMMIGALRRVTATMG